MQGYIRMGFWGNAEAIAESPSDKNANNIAELLRGPCQRRCGFIPLLIRAAFIKAVTRLKILIDGGENNSSET